MSSTKDTVRGATASVTKGIVALVASRFITLPISILVNAMLARRLGATDFGSIYLATAGITFVFLFVEFGTNAQGAGAVARDHASAQRVLGSGIALRIGLSAAVFLALPTATRLLHYSADLRMVFMLIAIRTLIVSISNMASAVVRGLEQISINARLTVYTALVEAAVLIPVLLLGGGLRAALIAQIAGSALGLLVWWWALVQVGVARPTLAWVDLRRLLQGGFGFVVFDLAMRFQPYLDATFLERLAPPEVVGWYAAANRIVASLLLPATTLNFAIYPVMARLWASDRDAYMRITRLGLRVGILFGGLAAVAAAMFSDVAIGLVYGHAGYAPAVRDLQILAAFVGLLYLSMLLGCAILATHRQLHWAAVQALCIPVSLILDPWLIPVFQARYQNGGLAVCISVAAAELLMVSGALVLTPRGVFHTSLLRDLGRAVLSGGAMAAVALGLHKLPVLAIPVSLVTYFGVQAALGGLDRELTGQIRTMIGNKLGRPPLQTQAAPPS